jgi:hypothetical protein
VGRPKATWPAGQWVNAGDRGGGPWLGQLAAEPIGPKVKGNSFPNKDLIFEYTKALEIWRRRFRRDFDMRIFPKIL